MHRFKTIPSIYRTLRHHQTHIHQPVASLLKSRSVIRFSGPDTIKFLQGLLTNDVRKFQETQGDEATNLVTPNVSFHYTPPMYAALLTPQGKFLYDLFLYKPPQPQEKLHRTGSGPGSDPNCKFELFADVDSSVLDELLQTFKKYRLRSKVEIENLASDFSCWQRYGGELSESSTSTEEPEAASDGWSAGIDRSAMSASHGDEDGWQWFKDPRLDCLGFRGIFQSNSTSPMVSADKETDETNYLLWRTVVGVAEGSNEIPKGVAMPLEYNLAGLNAISFNKGCYVGQELIARTHHRGVIRKRLVPLRFLDDGGKDAMQKVAPNSEVIDKSSGKKIGVATTALGCRGLGVLRLEDALKEPASFIVQGVENVNVKATRPRWWPAEWHEEHEQH